MHSQVCARAVVRCLQSMVFTMHLVEFRWPNENVRYKASQMFETGELR